MSRRCGVPFLSSRRDQHDLLFLKGLFAGKINSAELLVKFPLHVPPRSTRTAPLFAESRAQIIAVQSGLVCRVARITNAMLEKTKCLNPESDLSGQTEPCIHFRSPGLNW